MSRATDAPMNAPAGFRVLGTAGHVDHGKTALVKALTGIDTTHLPEEREREITIQPGYAYMRLPSGRMLGIVDVPGHEKLIKNMLAGACGIDVVLLVVAADEGVMPQTVEHLHILQLLGVREGVVALTKADLVSQDRLSEVREEVSALVSGTFLDGVPVIPTSAVSGTGITGLRDEIARMADKPPAGRSGFLGTRMPIDRVFTLAGHGTVVTGTMFSGAISEGQRVAILPKGLEARVRGLQVHGVPVESASCGQRTAVNLSGVAIREIGRGDVLADPAVCQVTRMFDAAFVVVKAVWRRATAGAGASDSRWKAESQPPELPDDRARVHVAASDVVGRMVLLGKGPAAPGFTGAGWGSAGAGGAGGVTASPKPGLPLFFARIVLEDPVVVQSGDRFVVRLLTPPETVGGGEILNPCPPRRRDVDEAYLASLAHASTVAVPRAGRAAADGGGRLPWLLEAVIRSVGCMAAPDPVTLAALTRSTLSESAEALAATSRRVRPTRPRAEGSAAANPGEAQEGRLRDVRVPSGVAAGKSIWVHASFYAKARDQLTDALGGFEREHPEAAGLAWGQLVSAIHLPQFGTAAASAEVAKTGFDLLVPTREEAVAAVVELARADGLVKLRGDRISTAAHQPGVTERQGALASYVERCLLEGGANPPAAGAIAEQAASAASAGEAQSFERDFASAIKYLLTVEKIVRVGEGLYLAKTVFDDACGKVRDMVASQGRLTIADVRQGVGTSRRFALGLLDATDRLGYTRRVGDVRVKGIRAEGR